MVSRGGAIRNYMGHEIRAFMNDIGALEEAAEMTSCRSVKKQWEDGQLQTKDSSKNQIGCHFILELPSL